MRPLRLELTAFGPFGHTQVIDFRELGGHRLFLVHGPTGAGKTTLLDAICFALYGDATGAERDGKGFRSHFAPPERPTSVTLDFALGERVYRISRQPEQERAKLRGEGMTVSAPAATLWDRTDVEDDAGEGRVLAARASQASEEVASLLGFRSEQFRQVIVLPQGRFRDLLLANSRQREDILRQLFDTEFYGRLEGALKQRSRELKAEAEQLRAQRGALLEQESCADEAEVEALLGRLEEELQAIDARADELQLQSARASESLERARALHSRFQKLERAGNELAVLESRRPGMDAERNRLLSARRAEGLADLAERLADKRSAEAEARAEFESLRQRHEAATAAITAATTRLRVEHAREPERAALRDRLAGLERVLPLVTELVDRLEQRAAADARHQQAGTKVAAAREALNRLRVEAAALRQGREEGSAALLAQALRPGEPCPVCGSIEHPRKAGGSHEIPSAQAIAAADRDIRKTEASLEEALEAERASDRMLAGQDAAVKALEEQLTGLVEPSLEGLRESQRQVTRLRADAAAAQAALERAVAEERAAQEQSVRVAASLEAAARNHHAASGALEEAAMAWGERRARAGFADDQAYLEARLSEGELERAAAALERYERELATAQTVALEARAAVEGIEAPDLAAVESAADAAAQAYRAAVDQRGRLANRVDALGRLRTRLDVLAEAYRRTEARFGAFGAIARTAGGDNPHRISLQRFVLASRLDDVLAAASRRLRKMTRGRYLIRRNTETADRRSAGGLELEVEDAYTASARPVATLSGGESFQAALALALGLSEVVQAYAGGIRLDTIFIDEGFGSLDPEALDLAIDTLQDLQAAGRTVGVISHVPELQERIDVRLEVLAGAAGSRAEFRLP